MQAQTGSAIVSDGPVTAADIPALAVEGLSHSFGARKALDDASFAIAAG